jgi:Asp-tRNA(Asn)/Glu-tRNA(Gln) amidotransferase A subunit family amidase
MPAITFAESAFERITAHEERLHAYAWLDFDTIVAEARRMDTEGIYGPLSGHTVAIKDIFDTADMPTGCGSPIYEGRRPNRDAAAVAAIRAAGGLVIGKAVTTEFAHLTPGPTRNPHNVTHIPGGSSSGSAATVAAGGATLVTGTQTAGSIIRPPRYVESSDTSQACPPSAVAALRFSEKRATPSEALGAPYQTQQLSSG